MPYIVIEVQVDDTIADLNDKVSGEPAAMLAQVSTLLDGIKSGAKRGKVSVAVKNTSVNAQPGSGGIGATVTKK